MGTTEKEHSMDTFLIAAVQHCPVFLNAQATLQKACSLIAEAGAKGARLVVFPETFIPTYPVWSWVVQPRNNRMMLELYAEYVRESLEVPGEGIDILRGAAKASGTTVIMGISERSTDGSKSSLYNTTVYINETGEYLGKHRKLMPTAAERMVWGPGDGSTLDVYETPFGRIGGLICWENYMPLARYAMYAQGVQLYAAPTWDSGEPWISTMRHIAKEGRVYVVGCCIPMRVSDIPDRYDFKNLYRQDEEWINTGESVIVDPDGKILAGPCSKKEEILYAEVDPVTLTGPRWKLDVAGHYARPDVFHLSINREPLRAIHDSKAE